MRRNEINHIIRDTISFFKEMKFELPLWAYWCPEDWRDMREITIDIVTCGLGWDVTDFGSGNFEEIGLVNFNLRNGIVNQTRKQYCEKIIVVRENHITSLHSHYTKIEDIINRGGGNLVIELHNGDEGFQLTEQRVIVKIDAIPREVPPGGRVVLTPGESICLEPGVFHKFWGEQGHGKVLVGEVSSVNDDATDNVFIGGNPRFPVIEEDEPPAFLLVNDYQRYL